MTQNKLAPIVVLEGLDSCGKSKQIELLKEKMKQENRKAEFIKFPGYEKTKAGKKLEEYLQGKMGALESRNPFAIAALYAFDRAEQKTEIEQKRQENEIIFFDRGISANMMYQSARGKTEEEIENIEKFIQELEYKLLEFPKEDLVIFLDASDETREIFHGKKERSKDLHEANDIFLKKVREQALKYSEKKQNWKKIIVEKNGSPRNPEEICEEIWDTIQKYIY